MWNQILGESGLTEIPSDPKKPDQGFEQDQKIISGPVTLLKKERE